MGNMHANVWFIKSKILQLSIQKESHLTVWSSNHSHAFLYLFLLLVLIQPATAQLAEAESPALDANINNKSDFTIMGIVVVMFFISGFLSLYSRQCSIGRARTGARINLALPTGDTGHPSQNESHGLNQEIVDTFPTFLYSNVKGLKIGKGTLACAVCLNEFQDDETLRLIPKCNHVFHPSCIDVWLVSHSTCPVCRANLVPTPEDAHAPQTVSIQIPDHDDEETVANDAELAKVDLLHRSHTMNHSRPSRSRSTRFLFSVLFPRCNSTGHHSVLVPPGEDFGRFTLRLPDEVRSHVLNSGLKRVNSSVSFKRMSSGRMGYRARSVGSERGRSYLRNQRFGSEEEWGFTLTPSFVTRNRSARKSHFHCSGVALLDNDVGERSSDPLCPG